MRWLIFSTIAQVLHFCLLRNHALHYIIHGFGVIRPCKHMSKTIACLHPLSPFSLYTRTYLFIWYIYIEKKIAAAWTIHLRNKRYRTYFLHTKKLKAIAIYYNSTKVITERNVGYCNSRKCNLIYFQQHEVLNPRYSFLINHIQRVYGKQNYSSL